MATLIPEAWQQARALFETCLELASAERETLLAEKARVAPKVVDMVRAMLVADSQTDSPVEKVAGFAKEIVPKAGPDETLLGLQVGAFRIARE